MNELVFSRGGILTISQDKLSELTNNNEKSIQDLIVKYKIDLENFGTLGFDTIKTNGRPQKQYFLNEQQSYLFMTFLKNTKIVKEFKIKLIQEFFKMKEALNPHQINGYKSQLAQRNTKIKQLEATIIDQNKLLAKTPKKDTLSPEDSFLMKEIKSLCMETDDLKMQLSRTNKSFMNDPSMHKDFLEFIYHANKALVEINTIKHLSPAVEQTYQSLSNSILFITRRYENIRSTS